MHKQMKMPERHLADGSCVILGDATEMKIAGF